MAAEDYTYMGHMLGDDVPSFGVVPCTPYHSKFREEHPEFRNHGTRWTDPENQVLRNGVRKGLDWATLSRRLRRTENACQLQAERLGIFNPNQPTVATQSKGLNVNHMHLITLMQEGYTTCSVILQNDEAFGDGKGKTYTYKMPKDAGVVAGDRVVVYAREQLKVGRVYEVHEEPQIDFKAPYALKWIVQKVELAQYGEHVAKEAAALAHLTALQRKKDQEKMLNELFGGQEGLEELKRLING